MKVYMFNVDSTVTITQYKFGSALAVEPVMRLLAMVFSALAANIRQP